MKEWDNVNKANKAIGVIEGVAAGLRDGLEGLLMASCEVIDETLRDLMTQSDNDREEHRMDQTLIHTLLKDKDDLLTENSRLRDMLEKMATEDGAEEECSDEIATAPAEPRNDSGCLKVQTDNPSVACGDSSPKVNCREAAREAGLGHCTGEPLGAGTVWRTEDGCTVCKEGVKVLDSGGTTVWIKGRRLRVETAGFVHSSAIAFCPKCGRKL